MKEALDNITVNGRPLKVYVEEQQRSEIEKVTGDEIRQKSAGLGYQAATGKFGNTSGAKTERRDYATVSISAEVKHNVDFLQKYQGEKAVSEYLNKNRQDSGTIETAHRDAKERLGLLRREMQTLTMEIVRYESVVDKLEETLQLLSGKVVDKTAPKPRGHKGASVSRREEVKNFIRTTLQTPMSRKALWQKMIDNGDNKHQAYQAIHIRLKNGQIVEQNGLLHWMEQ